MESSEIASFGYSCKMKEANEPELLPQEEVYIKILKTTLVDNSIKKKLQKGNVLLTTHRIIWYSGNDGLEMPLFYVKDFSKGGGFFHKKNVTIIFQNHDKHSPYIQDLYMNVLKKELPPKPQLHKDVIIKFEGEFRDKFADMLKEALSSKNWLAPIKIQTGKEHLQHPQQQTQQQKGVGGIAGIKKQIETQTKYNQDQISSAFQDLNSLKEKAKNLVGIANQIQNKIKKKELNADTDEMREIQAVMFNMGLITDFSSQVTKDLAGKNYFSELALEVEKFAVNILDKFGGVLALVDLYCMYNRARGTDLISPEDLMIACEKLNQNSTKVFLRTFASGVKVVQLKHFNQETYFDKLASIAKEQPGLTADKMANLLKVNVVLMKELLRVAEEKGFLCRDESLEGLSNQKDLLIHQLQAEIFELRGKGKNYNQLRDQMIELEQAYRRLLEDKVLIEDQSMIQAGFEDSLRSKQNAELASEIQRLKQINNRRDEELINLNQDISSKYETQQALKGEFEDFVYEISQMNEDKAKFQNEVSYLHQDLKVLDEKSQTHVVKQEDLQYQLQNLQEQQVQQEKQIQEKERDLQRKQDALFSTNAEIQRAKELCEEMRRREQSMESQTIDRELQNKEHDRLLIAESNKLTQLRQQIDGMDLENSRADKQVELQRRENESIKAINQQQADKCTGLREELMAVERHAKVLEEQNKALVVELEKFSQADEAIKTTLDRRGRVQELKETLNNQLQKSVHRLRMTSPEARRREQ